MTSFRCLAIVLLLAAGSLQAQVSWTRVQPQARAEAVAPSVPLQQHFRANDATYEVSLPDGWQQVGQATLDYGLFFGTRTQAESFAVGMEQVFTNPAMLRAQLPGYSDILPPAQLVLKGRLLAPPLTPLQIVTILLPKLAGGSRGAIQSLRVNYTIPANMSYGYNGMLIEYQYVFIPGRDPAFASQAHPVLRPQTQVPMQAAAFIVTFPYMLGQDTWSSGYRILSAPQAVFQSKRNKDTYVAIFDNFQLIPQGLALKVKSNEEAARLAASMNKKTHDVAHDWWVQLGAGTEPAGSDFPPGERPYVPAVVCGPYETKYFCEDQRGQGYYICVTNTQRPKESSLGYNCRSDERAPGSPR
jgi:hypothetical protein